MTGVVSPPAEARETEAGPEDPASAPAGGSEAPAVGARGLRLSTVIGACFALWGAWMGIQALSDNSFLTHLATGRLIFQTGGIPRVDPYSYTAAGEPWVVQSWLASWVYAGAERLAGLGAIRVLNALTVAALAAMVWRLTRSAGGLAGRIIIAAAAMAVGSSVWSERPLLFGLVAFALVLWAMEGDGIDPRWLVPVAWLWVNLHGSFPLGLAVAGLFCLGTWLDGDRTWSRLRALREARVVGWLSLGILAGALNPLGPRLLAFPLLALSRRDNFSVIVEWQPPRFDSVSQIAFLAMAVAMLAIMLRRPSWRSALPVMAFTAAALLALRNVAPASLVLVVAAAHGFGGLGSITGAVRRPVMAVAGVVVVAFALVSGVVALRGPDLTTEKYPVDALAWMEGRGLLAERVLAPDYVGNLLEARTDGGRDRVPVFIDDRVDMYPPDVVEDYVTLLYAEPGWSTVLRRWEPSSVVWPADQPLAQVLEASPAWQEAWRDADWVVMRPSEERVG